MQVLLFDSNRLTESVSDEICNLRDANVTGLSVDCEGFTSSTASTSTGNSIGGSSSDRNIVSCDCCTNSNCIKNGAADKDVPSMQGELVHDTLIATAQVKDPQIHLIAK